MRLMIDYSGANRGFAFATFGSREEARAACARLNNYEIRAGKHMGVVMSIDNCRLFVGNIPRDRNRDDIYVPHPAADRQAAADREDYRVRW